MNLTNLKRASNFEVEEWLEKNIVELTTYQKQKMSEDEIIRFSPFKFFKHRKKVDNILVRLTVIFIPIVWIILFLTLPINFLITGNWGYKYDKLNWFNKWRNACGL